MQIRQIVNRLRATIGQFTDDFSDIQSISSLTQLSGTVTANTDTAHNLTSGDYVVIRNAKEPINLTSLTRDGNVVSVVSSSDHKLIDPSQYADYRLPLYVEITNASPVEFNGTFKLLSVSDSTNFTFEINTTPSSPATSAGTLLLKDYDSYNGLKEITVTSPTEFTYSTTNSSLVSPAQGNIELSKASRIDAAATPERILEFYSASSEGLLQNWLFISPEAVVAYKNDTVASDLSASVRRNQDYYYSLQNSFSIFVIIPAKNSTTATSQYDQAISYLPALLASIGNYQFESNFTDPDTQPCYLVGHESDDYIKAYYVHRFDFACETLIQRDDTVDFNAGTPLRVIDGSIKDKNLTYKPNLR